MTLNFAYPTEVSRPYMPNPQKIFEALRTDLEAVGVKVNAIAKPWNGGYLDGIDAGAFDAWIIGWTGDYNAADNFLGTFFAPTKNDFHTFSQPWGKTLSADLKAADAIVDENERTAAYEKIATQIKDEYIPGLPLLELAAGARHRPERPGSRRLAAHRGGVRAGHRRRQVS